MLGDIGEVLVGLLVAVIGFLAVVVVCAGLLALFQRILPGTPQATEEGPEVEGPGRQSPANPGDDAVSGP